MVDFRVLRNPLLLAGFLVLALAPVMLGIALITGPGMYAWIGLGLGLSGGLLLWAVKAPWWQVWGSLGALMLFWGAWGLGLIVLDGLSIYRAGLGSSRHATVWILNTVVGLGLYKLACVLKPTPAPPSVEPPLPTPTGPAILHEEGQGQWWELRGQERLGPFTDPEEAAEVLHGRPSRPIAPPPTWDPIPEMRLLYDDNGQLTAEFKEEWSDERRLDVDLGYLVPPWCPWADEEGEELTDARRALYFRNDLRVFLGLSPVLHCGAKDGLPLPSTVTPERVLKAVLQVHDIRAGWWDQV